MKVKVSIIIDYEMPDGTDLDGFEQDLETLLDVDESICWMDDDEDHPYKMDKIQSIGVKLIGND